MNTSPPNSPTPTHNQKEYTVSEISGALKRTVEDNFNWVRVRGEISGLKQAGSGHIYFSLKDNDAVLSGICWKGVATRLTFLLEDGLEVICAGKISTFPGQSKYQIIASHMEPAGEGALMALLEKRKQALAAEGLFDEARKKPLPLLPKVIGVVTSPSGAVIRDILHRITERFPVHVIVWPVLVQGKGAKEQIAAAIKGFNALPEGGNTPRPDLIIVARGGGSLEDLWAFNEEEVVRAAAASRIPLISAVGHETDTTLIDYAADKRAPTPTAAAEIAVPVREEWLAGVMDYRPRLQNAINRMMQERTQYIVGLARGLVNPVQLIETRTQQLDVLTERLHGSIPRLLEQKSQQVAVYAKGLISPAQLLSAMAERIAVLQERLMGTAPRILQHKLQQLEVAGGRLQPSPIRQRIAMEEQRIQSLSRLLESYHYKKVLARGFALVRDDAGNVVMSSASVSAGMALQIEFADGVQQVIAEGSEPGGKRKNKSASDKRQESLF